jgi:lipopolysaccharide transport system permease protein
LRDWALFRELLKRDLTGRYRGSFGGVAWAFIQPLFLLCVYTFTFGAIAGVRWRTGGDIYEYGLYVFAGLIVYNAFSECLTRAPTSITSNPNYVKKVVFPLHLLPLVVATTALVHAIIGLCIWFAVHIAVLGTPKLTSPFGFLVVIGCVPALAGLSWCLSAFGAFYKDLAQLCVIVTHALLFLTPIFYGLDHVPQTYRVVLELNPLTWIVESLRSVLMEGSPQNGLIWFYLALIFFVMAGAGYVLFQKVKPRLSDAL